MSKMAMRSRTSWDPQQAHTDFGLWTAVGTMVVAGLAPKGLGVTAALGSR